MAAAPAILAIAAVASTAISAYSQYEQGRAQKSAYRANAKIAESEAVAAREKAILDEQQSRQRTKRLMGTQRSLYAKAGVDLSSGSPLLMLSATAAEGEEEAQVIRAGGDVEEYRARSQAGLNRYYGRMASAAGTIGAGTTLLSGLGQAGTMYAKGYSGGTGSGVKSKNPFTGRY